jgi:SNF2 family DNA or RNA helicase
MSFSLANYDWPAYQGRKPFAHQRTTVEFQLTNMRGFVLNEMGTGKTLSTCWTLDILFRFAGLKRAYIVAPLSILKSAWARELFFNMPYLKYAICHGNQDYKRRVIASDVQIVIINPDGVTGMHDILMRRSTSGKDVLIIDESTLYKSGEAERTKKMMELAPTFKACWGMSGDAAPNKPTEAWSQAQIVVPKNPLLPKYFGKFRDSTMYKIDEYNWGIKTGAEHLVAAILQPSIRFRLRDCIDLPETIYTDIEVPMSKEQLVAYEQMKEKLYIETEQGEVTAANAAVKLMKLVQICAGSVKDDEGKSYDLPCGPSLDQVTSIYEQTSSKKLIIVCAFQASFRLLKAYAQKHSIKCGEIYGEVGLKERDAYVEYFQRSDLNWLLLQPQAAAHGLTLTASSHLVWWTLVPSNELYKQTNARIIRPGQKDVQNIIRFIRSPAEKHIARLLERKEDFSGAILNLLKRRGLDVAPVENGAI